MKREPNAAGLVSAPAAERNQAPLTTVLEQLLPSTGRVLEVASGTGQHVAHWACHFQALDWQPSEADGEALELIEAWRGATPVANLRSPFKLDLGTASWSDAAAGPWDAVIAVNLLHISPWAVTVSLLRGCARVLAPSGRLVVYGPFAQDGVLAPASNVAFDTSLRTRDPAWGVRDVRDVGREAMANGLVVSTPIPMPANNHVLVVARATAEAGIDG